MADPRPLDAAALASWAPLSHEAYEALRTAVGRWHTPVAEFSAVLDQHLPVLAPAYQMQLLDRMINAVVHLAHSRTDFAIYQGDPFTPSAELTRRVAHLVLLIERLRVDQAGMDFVGIVLVSAFLRVNGVMGPPAEGFTGQYTRVLASAITQHVIHPLLGAPSLRGYALQLTLARLIELARAWAARGTAVHVVGTGANVTRLTPANLDEWVQVLGPGDSPGYYWNRSIRVLEQQLRREAYRAQNELRRETRLPADLTGAVAQFLAPASTTQADLQRQRELYQAAIGVARLQVQADAAPANGELARRVRLARGAMLGVNTIEADRLEHVRRSPASPRRESLSPMYAYSPPPTPPMSPNTLAAYYADYPGYSPGTPAAGMSTPPMSPNTLAAYNADYPGESPVSPTDARAPTPPDSPHATAAAAPVAHSVADEEERKSEDEGDEENDDRAKRQRTSGRLTRPW